MKLSKTMRAMLLNVQNGKSPRDGLKGRQWSAAANTLTAVTRRGLVRHNGNYGAKHYLTDEGRRALGMTT